MDNQPIQCIKHPIKVNLWTRIVHIFKRPKFSKEALEPAEYSTFTLIKKMIEDTSPIDVYITRNNHEKTTK